MKTILVPCDGASNIKLTCYDFDTLTEIESISTHSPSEVVDGIHYNSTMDEFEWFDSAILQLPEYCRNVAAISPVGRGASGGLIDRDGNLIDCKSNRHTLSYSHHYSKDTEEKFAKISGDEKEFFYETGSISTLPGSLTLIKRFLFEELERPELASKAESFATYPALMSGHFLGDDYLLSSKLAGNEHSYWMCHTGSRNIKSIPTKESTLSTQIPLYQRLVTKKQLFAYKKIGMLHKQQAEKLKISEGSIILPGGHDTSFSHIPVTASFYQRFPNMKDKAFIHLEIGTWIMGALIGAFTPLKKELFGRGIIVQGTVDGNSILTSMYAGGSDFKYLKTITEKQGLLFECKDVSNVLKTVLLQKNCFVLPNVNTVNRGHGPFPTLKGRIIDENYFFSSGEKAFILSNLMSALVSSYHLELINSDANVPIVITGGGAKSAIFGDLLTTLTGKDVYTMYTKNGDHLHETTSLGSAIIGKAGCCDIHPYNVDISSLGIHFRKSEKLSPDLCRLLLDYRIGYLSYTQMP